MSPTRHIVDSQWHWYPRPFFEAISKRAAFPRCHIAADEYRLEISSRDYLAFSVAECELDAQIEAMDRNGVDAAIVSPGSLTVEAFGLNEGVRLANLLNAEMALAQTRYPTRIVGAATIPFMSPAAAIGVLDHATSELGLRAAWLPSNAFGDLVDVHEFGPLFGRMEELGVVGLLHPVRTMMAEKLRKYGLEYVVGYPFDTSIAALTLILGGVMEAMPDLKIVHPHLGGVLPYLAGRIDREYRNPWAGNTPLPHAPSTYIRRFYTDTVSDSAPALQLAIDFYGVDHVLFASDHPWWPVGPGIDFVSQNTSGEVTEAILGANAEALLGVNLGGATPT